jgi:hypothetical protein
VTVGLEGWAGVDRVLKLKEAGSMVGDVRGLVGSSGGPRLWSYAGDEYRRKAIVRTPTSTSENFLA